MWFVEVLLAFCAVLMRWLAGSGPGVPPLRRSTRCESDRHSHSRWGSSASLRSRCCRPSGGLVVPDGQYWRIVGLSTPAYLPQYAEPFRRWTVACRRGWVQALPVSAGWFGLKQALTATVAVGPVAMLARSAFAASTRTWGQILFAIWGLVLRRRRDRGSAVLCRQQLNRQGTLAAVMSQHAYTVYIIHPLVLVGLGYSLRWLHAIAIVKFTVIVVLGIPLCWAVAYLIRGLPYARRVLRTTFPCYGVAAVPFLGSKLDSAHRAAELHSLRSKGLVQYRTRSLESIP